MGDNNKRQAYIPEGALPLRNPVGTAPCFLSEDVRGRGFVVSLPGVPRELEHMMTHVVMPILIERMGDPQVIKARILRTCAVGESNIDRAIADLMTEKNPTVGLAAHVGQTDVRITAKAGTEAETEALIAPMEAKLRERLGVAIYGVEKETVPEVVGRLLAEKGLKLAVLDTLTEGQLTRDLSEAGFGHLITADLHPVTLAEAVQSVGLVSPPDFETGEGRTLTAHLAEAIAPVGGIGLALVGPFSDKSTYIALHGPGDIQMVEFGRNFRREQDYVRRWLVIQGLDWVRRATLGQLQSPVDWR
jgi:hypothetical protein